MKIVGVSGGIASGKSTISRRFAELGAHRVDADQLAREAVPPGTAALARIAGAFGEEVIQADGSLDRAALAALVFGHEDRLVTLNGIVHPAVLDLARERFAEVEREDPDGVFVYGIPLLVESSRQHDWDYVVVAEAPEATRIERLVELRGMSRDEALARIRSQATDAERRALADAVIDTSGSYERTVEQVDAVWNSLRSAAA